ncbi:TLD-domain-containing protein [Mucor mucedo]|uniref:TLD-domain-containing protein n=1 Tax=Mucor mucedo TaxID=29922 RepID=UPI0022209215|nr:TLD-domain-containing protein [Mucor mucedo]KAI7873362.1 TLD-domain-containing protein [Mucor mucedo]
MKRLSTASTPKSHHHHHHHHSHHNSISSTTTSYSTGERLFPLHRSVTDDKSYSNNSSLSPITRFVCKLLGLAGPSARPRLWHKSKSTTSITKSSVISSYQPTSNSSVITSETTTVRKPTTITIVTPIAPGTLSPSMMEWGRDSLPNAFHNDPEDDASSVSSTTSTTSIVSTINSSISSSVNNSAAVDALVIASLIPTKAKTTNLEFDDMPSIILGNRKQESEVVLTEEIAELVRPYLPRRYRIAQKWNLLYSLDQHGASLFTLYSLMRDYDGPCMMIIKDADGQVFGSYLSNPLSSQSHYYGTGECFLWKSSCASPKIKTYPWTGKNDYMILSDSDYIAIGGGDGKFGLWLNSELEKGYSTTCPTFDNECLTFKPEFECMEMEIWGFSL